MVNLSHMENRDRPCIRALQDIGCMCFKQPLSLQLRKFFDDVASMCTVNLWIFVVHDEVAVVLGLWFNRRSGHYFLCKAQQSI